MKDRIKHELQHSAHIKANAEEIWGWASPAGQKRASRRAHYFLALPPIKAHHKILEIGCGTGLFTEKVSKAQAQIIATDLSEDFLVLARKKNIPYCEFKQVDAHNLTFPDNTFDIIYGSSILHHLDINKGMDEIYRTLKPGGKMVFAEPNMLNPQILIQKNIPFIKHWLGDSPDETAFIRWQIGKQLKKKGFQNISVFPYDFLHPITPKFMIKIVDALGKCLEKIPGFREIAGSLVIFAEKPPQKE